MTLDDTLEGVVAAARQVDVLLSRLKELNSGLSETEQLAEAAVTVKIQEAQLTARNASRTVSARPQHTSIQATVSSTRKPKDEVVASELTDIRKKSQQSLLAGVDTGSLEPLLAKAMVPSKEKPRDEAMSSVSPERSFQDEVTAATTLGPEVSEISSFSPEDPRRGYSQRGGKDNFDFLDLIEKEKRASLESCLTSEVDSERKLVREDAMHSVPAEITDGGQALVGQFEDANALVGQFEDVNELHHPWDAMPSVPAEVANGGEVAIGLFEDVNELHQPWASLTLPERRLREKVPVPAISAMGHLEPRAPPPSSMSCGTRSTTSETPSAMPAMQTVFAGGHKINDSPLALTAPPPSRATMTPTSESPIPLVFSAYNRPRLRDVKPQESLVDRSRSRQAEPQAVASEGAQRHAHEPSQEVSADTTLKDEVSPRQHQAPRFCQEYSVCHYVPRPSSVPSVYLPILLTDRSQSAPPVVTPRQNVRSSPTLPGPVSRQIPAIPPPELDPTLRNVRCSATLPGPVSRQVPSAVPPPDLDLIDPIMRSSCVLSMSPDICHEVLFHSPRLRSAIDVALKRRRYHSRSKYFARRPRYTDPKTVRSGDGSFGPAAEQAKIREPVPDGPAFIRPLPFSLFLQHVKHVKKPCGDEGPTPR